MYVAIMLFGPKDLPSTEHTSSTSTGSGSQPSIGQGVDASSDSDSWLYPPQHAFHYSLYMHYDHQGGLVWSINGSSGIWVREHRGTHNIQAERNLVGLVQIADLGSTSLIGLRESIIQEDGSLNANAGMTSEHWLIGCLHRLKAANFLKCEYIDALRDEIVDWGIAQAKGLTVGEPRRKERRPVDRSFFCDLSNGDGPYTQERLRAWTIRGW